MKDFEMIIQVLENEGAPKWQRTAAINELNSIRVQCARSEQEHDNLIRVCSPIVIEEDGSDLIPNSVRVQNALMRLIADRDSYKAGLKDLYDVACNGMIGDDALCMVNAEKLLEP